jgi:Tol biopolymer transport system component/DNA-binding winged helix-turn-helix (wHTH) protein
VAVFTFGPFVLDAATRTLLRDGIPQSLTPKAFDLLVLLVERRAHVLSKDELLKALWPDTFVDEANLSQQIFILRRTLALDSNGREYIATIPRRGYRFVAEASERPSEATPSHNASVRFWNRPRMVTALVAAGAVLAAVVLPIVMRQRASADVPSRLLSVTAMPGLERDPSISPDGNFVAFSWTGPDPEGTPDIWVKAVDSEALRRLTETPQAEHGPAWSPDGREIAFVRNGRGIFVASALGGSERQIARSGSMVRWTPDGRSVLVGDRDGVAPQGIFRIELDTGRRTQLTQASSGIGDLAFDISPDGDTLAFVRYGRPGVGDVYVAGVSGGEPRRRTNWNAAIGGVAWTPGTRDILYSVHEATGLDQYVFRVSADGQELERGARALHTTVSNPSVSRPGAGRQGRMAFSVGRVDVGLKLLGLESARGNQEIESGTPLNDSTRIDCHGRFSRDGQHIAFVSSRTGWAEAWVTGRDGSGLRQVTRLQATEMLIGGWSPDHRRLVIDAAVSGNSDVYVISLDGAPPVRLTTEPGFDGLTDWSADGRWIYFSSDRSGTLEVWKVAADGGRAQQVTRHGGAQPREAPDGRTLYYLDRPPAGEGGVSGTSRLMQVQVDGGDERAVIEEVRFGLWSALDVGIAFVSIESEGDALDFYSFATRQIRRVGMLPQRVSRIAGLGSLTVAPDGRSALVSVTDVWESDILVADGFR